MLIHMHHICTHICYMQYLLSKHVICIPCSITLLLFCYLDLGNISSCSLMFLGNFNSFIKVIIRLVMLYKKLFVNDSNGERGENVVM